MPHQYPGLSTATYWVIGIASSIILFASVLIHELSHSYIAKKNGLPIARITLFFFGGVSEMTEEPQDAGLEVRMAAAGPLMSFLIAGVLGAFWYLAQLVKAPVPVVATLGYGALINAALGLFNLVPAFPLDGGRVFRGSLWKRSGNLIGATSIATRVSEAVSLLMMLGGFVTIIFGDFVNGIWIVVLGWFIKSGAETSLRQTLIGEALSGITVGEIMTRNVLTVPPDITVQQTISDYFLVHPHGGYPVLRNGKIVGLITLQCARAVPTELRATRTVEQAMIPSEQTTMISPSITALDAMQLMARKRVGRLLIAENGQLLGIMTRGDLMKAIQTRQELNLGSIRRPEPSVGTIQPPTLGEVRYCVQCGGQFPKGTAICPYCNTKQPQ
jgi:Zn-dependent protease/predicted transcriptional regulator